MMVLVVTVVLVGIAIVTLLVLWRLDVSSQERADLLAQQVRLEGFRSVQRIQDLARHAREAMVEEAARFRGKPEL